MKSHNSKTNTKTVPQNEPTVGTTIQLPESLWKGLRNLATDRRVKMGELYREAVSEYLSRQQKKSAA